MNLVRTSDNSGKMERKWTNRKLKRVNKTLSAFDITRVSIISNLSFSDNIFGPCINTTSYVYDLKKYNEVVYRNSSYSFHIIFTCIRIGRTEYDFVYDTT